MMMITLPGGGNFSARYKRVYDDDDDNIAWWRKFLEKYKSDFHEIWHGCSAFDKMSALTLKGSRLKFKVKTAVPTEDILFAVAQLWFK